MAHNNQNISLESIAVAINIFDQDQVLLDSYLAIPPLNILYPDQSLPLSVFIDADLPDTYLAGSVLLISLPSDSTDPGAEILQFTEQLSNDERSAQITGSVFPLRDNLTGKEIWIAAVGFNNGVPVGIRKWISPENLTPGQEVLFDLVLYSLGPPIDEIQLYAELY
jgi:hypothetical protein